MKLIEQATRRDKMDDCIRAIYIWDVRFPDAPVFELNEETKAFEMVGDPSFHYDMEEVLSNDDWILFSVVDDQVKKLIITEQ